MRAQDFITEKKANAKTCRRGKDGKRISASMKSSCISQGLMPHKTGHTDGTGKQGVKGSGRPLNNKVAKSEKYGGRVKDYSKKR